jgi:cyclopropane fatty-acyl-phospholipid synthase-like methyltransferase
VSEEGAVERLARMLHQGCKCGYDFRDWETLPADIAVTYRDEARYLLAHASELRRILDSVQEVK